MLQLRSRNFLPINNLESYIARVEQIPMLDADTEHAYAVQYHESNDLQAAQQLVLPHLRYVARVARQYQGYGLPLADLVQEGAVGLMKAVRHFDPYQGARLVTFALYWIKAEIHEYVLRNWKIVKVATTKAQRKCFFKLRSLKARLGWFSEEEVHQVAQDLGVEPTTVREMEQRLSAQDAAFDAPFSIEDHAAQPLAPEEYLGDADADPLHQLAQEEQKYRRERVLQAIESLDDRTRDILQKRCLIEKKVPLKDLAQAHQVSIERVRQLEQKAIAKLKKELRDAF